MIVPYQDKVPLIAESAFVAPDAWIIGDIEIRPDASVFFGSVLRGDILPIRIGARTNIQEHSLLHTSNGRTPTIVGEDVTIGHRAILHGCSIGNRCLIGMGAIILDETVIEDECIIAAGAIVSEGKRIPARSMVMGVPGKIVRALTPEEIAFLPVSAARYVALQKTYRDSLPPPTRMTAR